MRQPHHRAESSPVPPAVAAAMATPGDRAPPEPRYTIEQISLLHRLLRTGLTKADIVHALDSMSKMDAELQAATMPLLGAPSSGGGGGGGHSPAVQTTPSQAPGPSSHFGASARRPATMAAPVAQQAGNGKDCHLEPAGEQGSPSSAVLPPSVSPEVTCGVENFLDITDEELESLFQRGPMAVKSEIRQFMTKHRLSQGQISMATGISQSYISAFLIHGFKMRRATQALLYRWYLGKRRELDGPDDYPEFEPLDNGPAMALANRCVEVVQAYPGATSHNYLPTFKRRERFIWRESHVRIMDSYYNKNPYPNDFEREKITEACNSEMQQSGESIPDNKWVTSSKVYNWFANRRKDSNRRKRLSQRMGLETSETDPSANGDYVAREDHTHYTSAGPQHMQVVEVQQEALGSGGDGGEEVVVESSDTVQDQPQQQQVSVAEDVGQEVQVLCIGGAGGTAGGRDDAQARPSEHKQAPLPADTDAKPYEGASAIYTLIEASHETDTPKGSQ